VLNLCGVNSVAFSVAFGRVRCDVIVLQWTVIS